MGWRILNPYKCCKFVPFVGTFLCLKILNYDVTFAIANRPEMGEYC